MNLNQPMNNNMNIGQPFNNNFQNHVQPNIPNNNCLSPPNKFKPAGTPQFFPNGIPMNMHMNNQLLNINNNNKNWINNNMNNLQKIQHPPALDTPNNNMIRNN